MNIVEHQLKLQYESIIYSYHQDTKRMHSVESSKMLQNLRKLLITQYGCESVHAKSAGVEVIWEIRTKHRKVYMYRFNQSTNKIILVGVRTYAMA